MSQGESEVHIGGEGVEEINVVLRMRPLNDRELDPTLQKSSVGGQRAWKIVPKHNSVVQVTPDGKAIPNSNTSKGGRTIFTFDRVFGEETKTREVYEFAAGHLIKGVVDGLNASIFAYGQTSSGKTHTMQGAKSIKSGMMKLENAGIIHHAATDLFHEMERASLKENRKYSLLVSVIEVYNEQLRDLLSKEKNNKLRIRENRERGVYVDAVRYNASTLPKLLNALSAGERNRVVAKTTLNKRSSRSHIIFSVHVESVDKIEGVGAGAAKNKSNKQGRPSTAGMRFANLNLIDLAGSESVRHRSSHSTENRRKEGGSINKSLLTLSLVIQALGAPAKRQAHVNFRDSKLTRFLQPSLSGNSRLAFICCATSSASFTEETKSTFQFASRIKNVKTQSKINLVDEDDGSTLRRVNAEMKVMRATLVTTSENYRKLQIENSDLRTLVDVLTQDKQRALNRIKMLESVKEQEENKLEGENGNTRGYVERGAPMISSPTPGKEERSPNGVAEENSGPGAFDEDFGYLADVMDKLANDDSRSTINGMPSNIRPISPSAMSEVTAPTRYGSHRSLLESIGV
uniref:Kinesin motor domain-containing protein n=1 Tax=Chaetoceros debilis TaxID=122233 RepID=A0A7S3PVM7_9STRA|mmetsp:Transcript_12162/g.18379  ORF Transcript_12162/g.18379 Transcript_12162/m.18379 type:complete len:573 (+) Transcript_12162:228-1946(+)|eukprot:CAMPEP_0194094686 /NCGR_PEP_ID=MMETSP0149-20130528/55098_1 /TAXON_ID=122233 /ORGANISM="Chaetoceros debilis, Strain MM31A-1" /LENGTH=572 /DNA_ID=CAMNT_0038780459 /DNA_START=215 /DNA_END=1933 /DNA_ORIENTATION=-